MKVEDVAPREIIFRRLAEKPMECVGVGCDGFLLIQAEGDWGNAADYPARSPQVPPFHIGCTGDPMHVWPKEHLFYGDSERLAQAVAVIPLAERQINLVQRYVVRADVPPDAWVADRLRQHLARLAETLPSNPGGE